MLNKLSPSIVSRVLHECISCCSIPVSVFSTFLYCTTSNVLSECVVYEICFKYVYLASISGILLCYMSSEMDEICPKISLWNDSFKPFFLELCLSNPLLNHFWLSFTSKSVQKDPTTIFFWQFFEISCLSFSLEWMLIGITETSEISTSTHFFSIWVLPINF